MVNLATLNYLPELQQYEAQIPRLEDGWWPTGGAVNPGADGGLMNWQASLLANRTAFLKKVIDDAGLGAAAVPLVTLNSAQARLTGSYRFASTDANTPAAGVAGTVEVIAASASAVNQMAYASNSPRIWTRFWNGTVWSAWAELWQMTGATLTVGPPSTVLFANGMIRFMGFTPPVAPNTIRTETYPFAFPNGCIAAGATRSTTTQGTAANYAVGVNASQSQIQIVTAIDANTNNSYRWFADGY
jgi:hypothetical protein